MEISEYLSILTQTNSKVGGGSVAAFNGALACGLIQKAINMILKKNPESLDSFEASFFDELEDLKEFFTQSILKDGETFGEVLKAYKLPKSTQSEIESRKSAIQKAFKFALNSPLEMYKGFLRLQDILYKISKYTDDMSKSEIDVAINQIKAGKEGARVNVLLNLEYIKDEKFVKEVNEILE